MSRIFPIGGGKGGVGKSFITANLGVILARQDKKVLLVDLDLGGSNLHTFFGFNNPGVGISSFLNKSVKDLNDVVVPTPEKNLFLISSKSCSMESANLFAAQKTKIIKAIKKLSYDYIFLDLGAGISFNALDFYLASSEGVFVFTPEPTSIENAFNFIKAVYLRKLKLLLKQKEYNSMCKMILENSGNIVVKATEIINLIKKSDPERGAILQTSLSEYRYKFILNQFRKSIDAKLGEKIEAVCNRHFYSGFDFLGNVGFDERVYDSILSRNIFVHKYPYTLIATDLENIAGKISDNDTHPAFLSKIS
jgi:flagellar biosynthesis protein FlhG